MQSFQFVGCSGTLPSVYLLTIARLNKPFNKCVRKLPKTICANPLKGRGFSVMVHRTTHVCACISSSSDALDWRRNVQIDGTACNPPQQHSSCLWSRLSTLLWDTKSYTASRVKRVSMLTQRVTWMDSSDVLSFCCRSDSTEVYRLNCLAFR